MTIQFIEKLVDKNKPQPRNQLDKHKQHQQGQVQHPLEFRDCHVKRKVNFKIWISERTLFPKTDKFPYLMTKQSDTNSCHILMPKIE